MPNYQGLEAADGEQALAIVAAEPDVKETRVRTT
jgi:hypothetical protein